MKLNKFYEFVQSDLEPVKSFHVKDELNPKVWENSEINQEVREQLLQIAHDFYDGTELEADVEDIILTGSLANYNWSEKYSDYDLHILIDFSEVNDDVELVKKYVDGAKNIWNNLHDIKIGGYEVEVYIQSVSEEHKSSGIYSLLNDKWIVKPSKVDFKPDEESIKEKAKSAMMMVDDLEDDINEDKYEKFQEKLIKVWEKIKNYRKSGLETEGGEYSTGNLVFKLLRRNGYIEKILKLKRKSYDKQFESNTDEVLNFLYKLDELDKVLSKHSDDHWSMTLDYEYDDSLDYIVVNQSSHGYSEGFSDTLKVYYKENPIKVERQNYGNTVLGDFENNREETFSSLDELLNDIKSEYGEYGENI